MHGICTPGPRPPSSGTTLAIAQNRLGSALPTELGRQRGLSHLYLSRDIFAGTLPPALAGIPLAAFWTAPLNQGDPLGTLDTLLY